MQSIEQRIVRVIAEQVGVHTEAVALASNLTADLGLDSLDEIEVVMALEDEFGFEIPDEDAEKWKTVQQIADYLLPRTA